MRKKARKIRRMFMATVGAAVLLGFTAFNLITFLFVHDYSLRGAFGTAGIIITEGQDRINGLFAELRDLSVSLAETECVYGRNYREMADLFFSVARNRNLYISSVYFGSSDGVFLQRGWSSPTFYTNNGWAYVRLPISVPYAPVMPPDYDPRERPWYRDAIASNGFVITRPYVFINSSSSNQRWGVTAAVPVFAPGSRIVGVLGIDCSFESVKTWLKGVKVPMGGKVMLFDSSGRIIYNPVGEGPASLPDPKSMNTILNQDKGDIIGDIGGSRMILSFRRNAETGFVLVAAFDYSRMTSAGAGIAILIGLSSAVFFIGILLFLFIGLDRLIKPIAELTTVIARFSAKDFSARIEVGRGQASDEIGLLAETFNSMADSIRSYEERLTRQLYFDRLTGLPSRQSILQDIPRAGSPVIFLVNIDSFRDINDFYGPAAGDRVLMEVTDRMKRLLSGDGRKLYRLHGDEFAVLALWEMTGREIEITANYYCEELDKIPVQFADSEIHIQVTIGVAAGGSGISPDELITRADMALKKAKKKGRHYFVYQESLQMIKEVENNLKWARKLKDALRDGRILPYYQPIMHNHTGEVSKYECLVRLIDEDGKIITPYYFLYLAKKIKLYPRLTSTVIERAMERFSASECEFSINLSVEDVLNPDTNAFLRDAIYRSPSVAERMVFEFVESENIENFDEVREFVGAVRRYGCKIAIDDFGTGYSNFEHILELMPDYLKIDASLIRNVHTDDNSRVVVRTIANFARELGIATIAEYVHIPEVKEAVMALGVDYSQGYYIGEPKKDL